MSIELAKSYNDLKRTLSTEFPKDDQKDVKKKDRVTLDRFLETEMVLSVLETIGPNEDVSRANILLGNQSIITNKKDWYTVSYLAKAHHRLKHLYPVRQWAKAVENYRKTEFDSIRQYRIIEKTITEEKNNDNNNKKPKSKKVLILERNEQLSIAPNRFDCYQNEILNYKIKQNKATIAGPGEYTYFIYSPDGKPSFENKHSVTITKIENKTNNQKANQKPQREAIVITMTDIEDAIAEIIKLNTKDSYFKDVIIPDVLKSIDGPMMSTADTLRINETINLVGMVSSGKSTLIKIIVFILATRGLKVVVLQNRVKDVFDLAHYFTNLKLSATPYIGKNHMRYIEEFQKQIPGCDYLPDDFSRYLESPCIISGLTQDTYESPLFGKEPCNELVKDWVKHVCPYYNQCPRMKMQREAITSNVIVTTTEGLVSTRIGENQELFLDYVLRQADLVIMDESDNVQTSVDRVFAPGDKFMNFIHDSRRDVFDSFQNLDNIFLSDRNDIHYRELQRNAVTNHNVLLNTIASLPEWNYMWNHYFSSTVLFEKIKPFIEKDIKDNFGLSEELHSIDDDTLKEKKEKAKAQIDELSGFLSQYISERNNLARPDVFEIALKYQDNEPFSEWTQEWLGKYHLKEGTVEKIKAFIIVSAFEEYILDIYTTLQLTTGLIKKDIGLFTYLQARTSLLQRFLPISPLGNVFGMKKTDEGIYLYRQFAYGRVVVTDLPWLYADNDGKPLGPHVLLLSGSSFAPGSLGYHINRPVNYVLDIELKKRNELEKTEIQHIPNRRVSGKQEILVHLEALIENNKEFFLLELQREGKILVIVNSYEQAAETQKTLANLLKDENVEVVYMQRASDEEIDENAISRDNIESFSRKSARILVAPAKAIERAYNIVEENGHSTISTVFFAIRPMEVPGDITASFSKLNGMIAAKFNNHTYKNEYEMAENLREFALKKWLSFEANTTPDEMADDLRDDLSASLFILILQIFGRAARFTDPTRKEPHLYFLDGAFRGKDGKPKSYDCLKEIVDYLDRLFENPKYKLIAQALYGPLYKAFKKGLKLS
jgi:energy-coupling factor transporter ATP-binding protein EcfA2